MPPYFNVFNETGAQRTVAAPVNEGLSGTGAVREMD